MRPFDGAGNPQAPVAAGVAPCAHPGRGHTVVAVEAAASGDGTGMPLPAALSLALIYHCSIRRTAGKLSAVGEHEDLPPLVFAELVGRRRAAAAFASVRLAIAVFPRPALIGAQADVEHLTGLCASAPEADSVFN